MEYTCSVAFLLMIAICALSMRGCTCQVKDYEKQCVTGCSVNITCKDKLSLGQVPGVICCGTPQCKKQPSQCNDCFQNRTVNSLNLILCKGKNTCRNLKDTIDATVQEQCSTETGTTAYTEVTYKCIDHEDDDDDNDDDDEETAVNLPLVIALVACGIIILILAVLVGLLFLRRRNLQKQPVANDAGLGPGSAQSPSRAGSTYARLQDGPHRNDSTYNHIPFDSMAGDSYTEVDAPVVSDTDNNRDKASKPSEEHGYAILERNPKPPSLPDRPRDDNVVYNVLNEKTDVCHGNNIYNHSEFEYDRVTRYPNPPKPDSDYSHLKSYPKNSNNVETGQSVSEQTTGSSEEVSESENKVNTVGVSRTAIPLPVAIDNSGDSSEEDVDEIDTKPRSNSREYETSVSSVNRSVDQYEIATVGGVKLPVGAVANKHVSSDEEMGTETETTKIGDPKLPVVVSNTADSSDEEIETDTETKRPDDLKLPVAVDNADDSSDEEIGTETETEKPTLKRVDSYEVSTTLVLK